MKSKKERDDSSIPLTCVLCGDTFYNRAGRGKYCSKTHFKTCAVCGKDFAIPRGKEKRKNPTCGYSCGAAYSHRSEGNKEKRRQNSLKKWGVEHPFQAKEVKEKIEKAVEGTAGRFGTEASNRAIKEALGVDNCSQLESVKAKKAATFKKNFTDKGIFPSYGPISQTNRRWKEKLEEATGVEWSFEKYFEVIGCIDLYAEANGEKVAVEINPTATHNSYRNLVTCTKKKCPEGECKEHTNKRTDHYDKARKMKELHNISLTSVFDWMDEQKVINFLKSRLKLDSHKVYARNVELREIIQTEANRFLKEFHMLGPSRNQKYCYGLFYDGELIQVQTFAPLRKDSNDWEARRLATRADWVVVGGVSKATKRFIEDVKPNSITAFSDLNLSWPNFDLRHNGFKRVSVNPPQKCWSKRGTNRMVLDKSAARQSADRLIGIANNSKESKYPEDWTNQQVFLAEDWWPVWDCGMIKDVWYANPPPKSVFQRA